MGEVWRAEQVHPFRRTVALKVIKAGMDTRSLVARFESERQALALMDHPNIAKVFDASATPSGRPFFVMEYVPGVAITAFCDQRRLSVRARLQLFIQVCEGVQHAHQKGIIHRDLKPSNVLVEEVDDRPVPKVIDFGLAKAMGQRLTELTMFTEVGGMVGTPAYMSPEQALPGEAGLDTRTDVYSLGVILYELLVGALPIEFNVPVETRTASIAQTIQEREPIRPSSKVRGLGAMVGDAAQKRQEDPESLGRKLRDELDWITMKALEKDRSRRYASCSELAADVRRYLENQPVLAGPPSTVYRATKFVRRHRFGASVAAGGVVLLLAFAVAMAIQAERISKERDRANREAEASKRVAQFMTDMFKVSDPSAARGNTITAREVLDRASREIDTGLAKNPPVQAQLMHTMGEVYSDLGLYPQAEALLSRAVAIRREVLGAHNIGTLQSENHLAAALRGAGRFAEAEKLQRQALADLRANVGAQNAVTLAAMSGLATILYDEGHAPEAESLAKEALAGGRRVLGVNHSDTLWTMVILASIYFDEGRLREAEELYREAYDVRRRTLGPDDPSTLATMDGYATTLATEKQWTTAEGLLREALASRRRVLGPEHRDTLMSMNNLANMLFMEGRYADAEKLERETYELQRRVLGPDHPDTAMSTYNLGGIAVHRNDRDAALTLLRDAVDHGLAPNIAIHMESDPDLAALHGDPRFTALLVHAKERAAAVGKAN